MKPPILHFLLAFWFFGFLASDAFAQYQPHAIWQREGAGDSSLYGSQILALGDQNGDGFNDWAVYAAGLGYAPPGSPNEPKVEFFHGGNPPDTIPYMVRVKDPATEVAVIGARALGDLNGDGHVDWYIFTEYLDDPNHDYVFNIYFGGPGPHEQPDMILTAPMFSYFLPVGDFNGDGYDDLLLSDGYSNFAAVFYGGNPMDTLADWFHYPTLWAGGHGDVNHDHFDDFISDTGPTVGPQIFLGGAPPDTHRAYNFPSLHSAATTFVKDVNGDSYDDLCYSEGGWGRLCWGGISLDTNAFARLNFPCSGSGPLVIASAGDFNHDGYNDIVMLHEWCDNSYGGVLTLHLGHPWINPDPAFVLYGWTAPLNLIHFKSAVNLGDVDGDGIDDLAIGANGGIEQAAQRGKVVILGGDSSLHLAVDLARTSLTRKWEVSARPNPFNPTTTVSFDVPQSGWVKVNVLNLLGENVATLVNERMTAGSHTRLWNAALQPSGMYFAVLESGKVGTAHKLLLLK